ncbi:MAG: FecR domain-containing protein [Candidatus Peribacteraceae bacterium]
MLHQRHRHGHYVLAETNQRGPWMRAIALIVIVVIGIFAAMRLFAWFGVGNAVRQIAVMLTVEGQGSVNVSIEGKDFKRADDQIKLYPQDRTRTSARASATLAFFDGTISRLNERTEVLITESTQGQKQSALEINLVEGSLWVATPTVQSFSGSIIRTVQTPDMRLELPSRTEAIISASSLAVFAADGLGISVWVTGSSDPILIGEGQQITLPENAIITDNPYRYRAPLDPLAVRSPFIEESRLVYAKKQQDAAETTTNTAGQLPPTDEDVLELTEPQNDTVVATSTVRVAGRVNSRVQSVRINGYVVSVDAETLSFQRDVALPDSDTPTILVEALAGDETVLAEVRRTIRRNREPPQPPVITQPAQSDQTYRTGNSTIEIIGEAEPDVVGIVVNDYRLQLYQPGDATWNYLASTKLDNLHTGENVFEVTAINKAGLTSEPAVITIIYNEGSTEGVIEDSETEPTASETSSEDTAALPNNVPLLPGSLLITGPTPGAFHSATGTSLLIEGTVPESTHSVYINDYKLQLYESGKTFFNYIADTALGTMHRGTNTYHIVLRNAEEKILDEMDYTVYFNPR